ncbi:FadR family transcriptional regulator [Massilia forsythiae]|uniref:FadR family transcriptional regulator n=1 Tax=Massilia forsythiae TaxID=2728020 RepID=A0A7Z2VZ66_9BURK|nr:FadR/GntR family transcriptional regulator [Massilia forsythiae]QJE01924.1 FadR family transcriptional regulator [Massilia forsythiae]
MNTSISPAHAGRKKHRTLAQGVIEDINERIRQSLLKPGDKLPTESAIMEQHGVSRTVVREAISHLQAAGLVQTRHGIGTFVLERQPSSLGIDADSIVTVRDVLAILELRISMETEAAWLAASRRSDAQAIALGEALADMGRAMEQGRASVEADVRFHRLVAEATGNRYFVEMLGQLGNALIPRARLNTPGLQLERPADYLDRVNREHEDICSAILRRDPEAARAAMRTHLSNSRERLRLAQQRLEANLGQA